MNQTFQGHGLTAIFINLVLAVLPLACILVIQTFPHEPTALLTYFWALCLVLLPHPTYLFFELKHLLFQDEVADHPNIYSFLVFGGLSLLGLVLQITLNLAIIRLLPVSELRLLLVISLSFISALGGCLGLTDLTWVAGLWPPLFLVHLKQVITDPKLFWLCLSTTALLSLLTWSFL